MPDLRLPRIPDRTPVKIAIAVLPDLQASHWFGDIADKEWRLDSDAYRLRTQRLVRSARARLRQPVGPEWFAG